MAESKGLGSKVRDIVNKGLKFIGSDPLPEPEQGKKDEIKTVKETGDALRQRSNPYGGNPCHYQTHVGDKQGMNRQGRTSGKSCHHGKS